MPIVILHFSVAEAVTTEVATVTEITVIITGTSEVIPETVTTAALIPGIVTTGTEGVITGTIGALV